MRALIAYYSRRGENYVGGALQNLEIGNTEAAALILRRLTGADCFQIEQMAPYSADYYRCIDQARQDLYHNARPALKRWPAQSEIDSYDAVYLGYPNYWGAMPMAVCAFLEGLDFSGKQIFPFCTCNCGGLGRSVEMLRRLCPDSKIGPGLALQGDQMDRARPALHSWLAEAQGQGGAAEPRMGGGAW